MFDLNPDVGHLMLDLDLGDPFERDVVVRGEGLPPGALRRTVRPAHERARIALGTRLMALGAALAMDGQPARRSPAP